MIISILRWLLLLPLNIGFLISAYMLSPFLPLFASSEGWLPRWLWWYQTPDNPLDGDKGFKTEHAPFKGNDLSAIEKYINRVFWLIRNPAYGFDFSFICFTPKEPFTVETLWEKEFSYFKVLTNSDGTKAWQLWIYHPWTDFHYAKINIGWKLWAAPKKCQYVFSIVNIWKEI